MKLLDSIRFDNSGLTLEREGSDVCVWRTASGDGLGLYYFGRPPDIGASLDSLAQLSEFYRAAAALSGARTVELRVLELDGCKTVRLLFKSLRNLRERFTSALLRYRSAIAVL